ncbi:MAG: pilus assembly protein [Paracoccaceae bacterium]
MKLMNIFKNFAKDESGAVTVDWVVLTAAIVGLGLAVIAAIGPSIQTAADNIGTELGGAVQAGKDSLGD